MRQSSINTANVFSERTLRFVRNLHWFGYWVIFLDQKYDSAKKIGFWIRRFLYGLCTLVALIKITQDGIKSVLNGTVIYAPLMVFTLVYPVILYSKSRYFGAVLRDLDEFWESLEDPKDHAIFQKYCSKLREFSRFFHKLSVGHVIYYAAFPIAFDTIFHYVFDLLSRPFILTYPHMSYLSPNATWDSQYYLVAISGIYVIVETLLAQLGWLMMYIVIMGYCYPVIVITKKAIEDSKNGDDGIRKAIVFHQLLVKLNNDLKAFLGLPCAFQTIFVSVTLTFTLFTTLSTTDGFILFAYAFGLCMHFSAGLLYCSLGQILENESEGIFEALYDLPWYRYSPQLRMTLKMMLRQSQSPFTIDYHSHYQMNLENFMEILKTSYSYFTLLQTLTSTT